MSKIRTPGGRRALRETDALHDKIEFLEQENLDLMLEVKAYQGVAGAPRGVAGSRRRGRRRRERAAGAVARRVQANRSRRRR